MPFSYRLRPGLHWTLCGGRPVFLDFAGDRYFCLGPMLEEAFLRFLSGDLTADDLLLFLVPDCAGAGDVFSRFRFVAGSLLLPHGGRGAHA